jgi:hypothetical protein
VPDPYVAQRASASAAIQQKGGVFTVLRKTDTVDPITQAQGVSTTTTAFYAVQLPLTKESDIRRLPEPLRERKVAKLLVAAKDMSLVPSPGDQVTDPAGAYWDIHSCTPLDPAGNGAIIYTIVIYQ